MDKDDLRVMQDVRKHFIARVGHSQLREGISVEHSCMDFSLNQNNRVVRASFNGYLGVIKVIRSDNHL